MKYLSTVLFGIALMSRAYAQGQIDFATHLPGLIDAPVFDVDCQTRLSGSSYLGQMYEGATPASLAAIGPALPFPTGAAAGYFPRQAIAVPGVAGPPAVYLQLRAWEASAGGTYDAAVSAGGKYGFSNIVPVIATLPPALPGQPIGLESFCLIPEPPV
jgi:hypothetical protein